MRFRPRVTSVIVFIAFLVTILRLPLLITLDCRMKLKVMRKHTAILTVYKVLFD